GLDARRPGVGMVRLRRAHVIRSQQADEGGLLLGNFVIEGINVVDVTAGSGLRLLASARGYGSFGLALDAIGIDEREAAFILDAGLKIQNAAREHVGRDERVIAPPARARRASRDLFAIQ